MIEKKKQIRKNQKLKMRISLKYILRRLKSSITYTLINILGLGISLTVAVVVFLFVDFETSFDRFNKDADQIFLATKNRDLNSVYPIPFSQSIQNEVAGVEYAASVLPWDVSKKVRSTKGSFSEKCMYLEESIFNIFSFEVLYQSEQKVFPDAKSIAISESLARKIFGDANLAVGKSITVDAGKYETISAVFKDIPANSSIKFSMAAPLQAAINQYNINSSWNSGNVKSFVKLNSPLEKVQENLKSFQKEHGTKVSLFPLKQLHLSQKDNSQKSALKMAIAASFFVMLLACVNFINLATADIFRRNKEVSINKILGSGRTEIFKDLIIETLVLTTVSFVIGVIVTTLILPYVNQTLGVELSFKQFSISKLMLLLSIVLTVAVFTTLIPFFFFSRTNPLQLFKKEIERSQSSFVLRKTLLVLQLSVTVIILIATLFVSKQVNYVNSADLGFNKENMLFLSPEKFRAFTHRYETFREELKQSPYITSVSSVDCKPGFIGSSTTSINWNGKSPEDNISCYLFRVGDEFFETFGLDVLEGKGFGRNQNNRGKVVINETFAGLLSKDALDSKTLTYGKKNLQIVGIVGDFAFNSIKEQQQPSAIFYQPSRGFYPCIHYTAGINIADLLAHIKRCSNKVYPELNYEVFFTDDFIINEYMSREIRLSKFFTLFSILGLLICCIGLLGLSLFESQKRTKEIGIRKVNGAKVSEVLAMLNKDFIKWVAIAFVIACPIAYYAMNKWLENFAYKTTLSWWIFALAGVLALGIALLTVSLQSWRAATRNPVEALRYE